MASARALLLAAAFLAVAVAAGSTSRTLHPGIAAPGAVSKELSPPLAVSGRTLHPAMAAAAVVGVLAPPATFPHSSSKQQGPDDLGLHRVVPVRGRDPPPAGLIVSIAVAVVLGLGALAVAMYYCRCARKRRAAAREQGVRSAQWVSPNDLAHEV